MGRLIDLTGRRFGRLVVTRRGPTDARGEAHWDCVCDCGGLASPAGYALRVGASTSCGCFHNEVTGGINRTHGKTRTPTYLAWNNMRRRCQDPENPNYRSYGARGISVCDRWQIFENFLADMGERPARGLELDRIDNDGNYEPGNCRWATRMQQAENKTTNRRLTIDGETKTVSEWGRLTGLGLKRISARINKLGWTPERAILEPVHASKGRRVGRAEN
jgi:hypothetical protein